MSASIFRVTSLLVLGACSAAPDVYTSEPTEPTKEFDVTLPDVDTDWPIDIEPDVPMDDVPFAGVWVDGWDGAHDVTNSRWQSGDSLFTFVEVDADLERIIAQNGSDNAWNPDLWSRFDWTVVDGQTWFCQSAFDAETADAARAVERADDSDPATGGCGGSFPWTPLYEPLPIRGTYTDSFGGTQVIKEWAWTSGDYRFDVSDYDVDEGWIVAQNADTNEYNPGMWSRFEWAVVDDTLYYCQVAYAAETEADALDAGPADATDPANGGCSTFPWTALTPSEG